jgi:hypothetical protein
MDVVDCAMQHKEIMVPIRDVHTASFTAQMLMDPPVSCNPIPTLASNVRQSLTFVALA